MGWSKSLFIWGAAAQRKAKQNKAKEGGLASLCWTLEVLFGLGFFLLLCCMLFLFVSLSTQNAEFYLHNKIFNLCLKVLLLIEHLLWAPGILGSTAASPIPG